MNRRSGGKDRAAQNSDPQVKGACKLGETWILSLLGGARGWSFQPALRRRACCWRERELWTQVYSINPSPLALCVSAVGWHIVPEPRKEELPPFVEPKEMGTMARDIDRPSNLNSTRLPLSLLFRRRNCPGLSSGRASGADFTLKCIVGWWRQWNVWASTCCRHSQKGRFTRGWGH